jgi:hypothetical protein
MPHIADLWRVGPVCQWVLGRPHGGRVERINTAVLQREPGEEVYFHWYQKRILVLKLPSKSHTILLITNQDILPKKKNEPRHRSGKRGKKRILSFFILPETYDFQILF